MDNIDREKRAGVALRAYPGLEEEDISSSIVDLVSDLLHLARSLDIEPDYVIRMAQMHFDAEVEEAAGLEHEHDERCPIPCPRVAGSYQNTEGPAPPLDTLEWTLEQLRNLTTDEYSKGGDRMIRNRLQETINKARG